MSNYPVKIDTDVELPRVDDAATEIAASVINKIREAIFSIQTTLGKSPQGSATDLVTRLSQSINDDGTLKSTALVIDSIVNAQIASGAAILESKLDLDIPTQSLQDQITSNDIDIAELQRALAEVIRNLALHVSGAGLRHDTFDIDLNSAYLMSAPPEFTDIVSTELHGALVEMNDRFIDHASDSKVAAHKASSISVDGSNFDIIPITVDDVQEALEALDSSRAVELVVHRDHLHANGFDNWANNSLGYNQNLQLVPSTFGQKVTAQMISGTRNQIRFDGIDLAAEGVKQGHIIVIEDGDAAGQYVIDDIGPRLAVGSKSLLNSTDAEIQSVFIRRSEIVDGYADVAIYGESSDLTFKGNVASVIHTNSSTLDSLQISRPNAARVLSLGLKPNLLAGGETLDVEVGLNDGSTRSSTITLSGSATLDSIVSDINTEFHGTSAFPAAAYRVGDELLLSHNWDGYVGNYIKILSTGDSNSILGFDGYGSNIVNLAIPPTATSKYYVNGELLTGFKTIASTTASIAGAVITFTDFNPEDSEVKPGNLIHVLDHATVSARGTYFITAVSSTTVTVHTSITGSASVSVEIQHDAIPLAEIVNSGNAQIVETFLDSSGRAKYNLRLDYDKSIPNLNVLDVSDNFISGEYLLVSTVVTGGHELNIGALGLKVLIETGFVGRKRIWSDSNIEFIEVEITGAISASPASVVNVYEHINEEEVLEVASVRTNGLESLSDVRDKRLFGTIGLDELREDVIQTYVETPLAELRSDGVIRGLDVITVNYLDFAYPSNSSLLIRGGTVYVDGVRCDVRTQTVVFPNTAGTFFVVLNPIGVFEIINESDWTLSEILENDAGNFALVCKVVHNGTILTSSEDLRFFLGNIDTKLDLIVDATNNFTGNFSTFEAALNHANNMPASEKPVIRVVSNYPIDITIPSGSRELTIQIDGYVESITSASPCRIEGRTVSDRTQPHVNGTLTTSAGCSSVEISNLSIGGVSSITNTDRAIIRDSLFAGNLTYTPSGVGVINVDNVSFSDDVSLYTSRAYVSGSRFLGAGNRLYTAGDVTITGTTFDEARYTGEGGTVNISSCIFENHNGVTTIIYNDGGRINVADTLFQDITTDTSGILVDLSANGGTISDSTFSSIIVTGTARILSASVSSNVLFEGNTYTSSNENVVSTIFTNCENATGTGDLLVSSSIFTSNRNVTAVKLGANGVCDSNYFGSSSTLGYNVDGTGSANVIVSGNQFSSIIASAVGVVLNSSSTGANVYGNNFTGADATSIAVSLTNSTKVVIDSNVFNACSLASTSGQQDDITVRDNVLSALAESMTVGNRFVFSGNKKATETMTLNTSSSSAWKVIENQFKSAGELNFAGTDLSDSVISNNTASNISFGIGLTSSVIANNISLMAAPNAVDFIDVVCSQNHGLWNYADSGNITWSQSIVNENIWDNGDGYVEFTIKSDGSNTPSLVNITQNTFTDNHIILSAVNQIDQLSFVDNFSTNTGTPRILDVNAHINNSYISRNLNFGINVNSGADSTVISLNSLTDQDLLLSGTVNGTSIDGNFVNNLVANCSSSNLSLSNNKIFNDLELFQAGGDYTVNKSSISNNSIVGDMIVGSGISGTDTHVFTNNVINGNSTNAILIFETDVAAATYELSGNTISNSQVSTDIRILTASGNYGTSGLTISGNTLSNNKSAQILISAGDENKVPYENTVIQGNLSPIITVGEGIRYTNLTINSNTVSNLTVGINPREGGGGGTAFFTNLSISNNQIDGYVELQLGDTGGFSYTKNVLNGIIISNNLAAGVDLIFRNDFQTNDALLKGFNVSGNACRSFAMLWETGSSSINSETLSVIGNTFNGVTGGLWEPGIFMDVVDSGNKFYYTSFDGNGVGTNNDDPDVGPPIASSTHEIRVTNNTSAFIKFYESSISDNKGLHIELENNGGDLNFSGRISNNSWLHPSSTQGISISGTSTSTDVANLIISGNHGARASTTGSGFINFPDTATIENLTIEGNHFFADNLGINLSGCGDCSNVSILDNRIVNGNVDLSDSNPSYLTVSGNFIEGSPANIGYDLTGQTGDIGNILFAGNNGPSIVDIDSTAAVSGFSFTGNSGLRLRFQNATGIGYSNIVGNSLSGLYIGTAGNTVGILHAVNISNNYIGITFDYENIATSLSSVIVSNNIVYGDILLPPLAKYITNGGNSITFNSTDVGGIGAWESNLGAFVTFDSNRVFVWGNQSAATTTTSVAFTGDTAVDPSTANNVSGGGITN